MVDSFYPYLGKYVGMYARLVSPLIRFSSNFFVMISQLKLSLSLIC